jgi:hypothetical protein
VSSPDEVLGLMRAGADNKAMASTNMNADSSRWVAVAVADWSGCGWGSGSGNVAVGGWCWVGHCGHFDR